MKRLLLICFIVIAFLIFGIVHNSYVDNKVHAKYEDKAAQTKELTDALEANFVAQIELYSEELVSCYGQIKAYSSVIKAFSRRGRRVSLGHFNVTAYDPKGCEPFNDGITSTGLPVGDGIFAVDPKRIPYGSLLYIPLIDKYGIAGDTGSAMRRESRSIDIFIPERVNALDFGRKRLEVQLVRF